MIAPPSAPRSTPSSALPSSHLAMVLHAGGRLLAEQRAVPRPGPHQVLLRVRACGVCRTDLHLLDGELPGAPLPRVPGHEIVGDVVALGADCHRLAAGTRVGVPWLHRTCGTCAWCASARENLCPDARFTGFHVDGGYAEFALADEAACLVLPAALSDELAAAPLLCAGLIGWRALTLAGDGARTLGLYGFGAAGHLIAQVARQQGRRVFAFTRPGDAASQALARELGCDAALDSGQPPPQPLDAALIFAPLGALVPEALRHTAPGGCVVCAGIHMSDIPAFPYRWLWQERSIRSVANLTRHDGERFFAWLREHPLDVRTTAYPLAEAQRALDDLRAGRVEGAAVLRCA